MWNHAQHGKWHARLSPKRRIAKHRIVKLHSLDLRKPGQQCLPWNEHDVRYDDVPAAG
jgi:hypothetical protein